MGMDTDELYFQSVFYARLVLIEHESTGSPCCKEAHYLLSKMHEQGIPSVVDKNLKLAFDHLEKAASSGLPKALTKLGHYYYSGIRSDEF